MRRQGNTFPSYMVGDFFSGDPRVTPIRPRRGTLSLLWTLYRLLVGQDSHLPIQPVLHVIQYPDSSTPLLIDTYPLGTFRTHGFHGEFLGCLGRHGVVVLRTTHQGLL